jgi:hypothetical protein
MKFLAITALILICFSFAYADDETKPILKGLDSSVDIQNDAKNVYKKDMKGNYGNKETIVDKLLKPLTGAMQFAAPIGDPFDAKLTCTDNKSEEIAVITYSNNSYGQANVLIHTTYDNIDLDLYDDTGQLLSGYFDSGIVTCPPETWNDKCRYFKFGAGAGTKQIFISELNDKTEVMQITCYSAACKREIDKNAINHITGQMIASINLVNLNGSTTADYIADNKISLKYNAITDCTPSAAAVANISNLDPKQRKSEGEKAVADMQADINSEFYLAMEGYKKSIGAVPSLKSCTITNAPSFYLQCPEGFTRDYETKCSKSSIVRDITSVSYAIENDKTDFQINRNTKHPNTTNKFALLIKISSPAYYGYDMDYGVNITQQGSSVYQKSGTINVHNPVVQISEVSLPYPEEAQNYSITVSAKPSDSSSRTFSLQVFEYYEILSEDVSNFNITTDDGCRLYENCRLTGEVICDMSGENCVSTNEAVGKTQQYITDNATIIADGSSFNLYDYINENYAKKVMPNAWFNIQREYLCQSDASAENFFAPADLNTSFGVIASVKYEDGVFSYTDTDGTVIGLSYTNEYADCVVPQCVVKTTKVTTEAFTDGTIRNSGEPKSYEVEVTRSCDVTFDGLICPTEDGALISIPCTCSNTATMINSAEAIATLNIINKILENLTCSSQVSK